MTGVATGEAGLACSHSAVVAVAAAQPQTRTAAPADKPPPIAVPS